MSVKISGEKYAMMYGPTTGDKVRLADTDMAQEMTTYTQQNVLNQAAISVLTQANDMPQAVLQLLQ